MEGFSHYIVSFKPFPSSTCLSFNLTLKCICHIEQLFWLSVSSGWKHYSKVFSTLIGQKSCCSAFNAVVAAFPKIFLCPYHLLTHLKSIFIARISWKITQVKRISTWLTFVRSEEDDPFGLLPLTLSLHDHSLWGLSRHLLLLGRIPISKWGLRPNTKVQAFAPHP